MPSDESLPLPSMSYTSPLDDDRAPSVGDLAEMVAAQRQVLAEVARAPTHQCDVRRAHERTLQLLTDELRRAAPAQSDRPVQAVRVAAELADIFQFSVPDSHRGGVGVAVTAVKRGLLEGLKPFHVELLRPQHVFNNRLVEVLNKIVFRDATIRPRDLAEWAKKHLEPVLDPTAWQVQSHRSRFLGEAIAMAKSGYLGLFKPLLEQVLEGQRQWNQAAFELVHAAAARTLASPQQAESLLQGLVDRVDPLQREDMRTALKASSSFWREVLRRQTAFNHQVINVLRGLLGVAIQQTEDQYARWIRELEPEQIRGTLDKVPSLTQKPRFSLLVPTFETNEAVLRACIDSVVAQAYPHWELCIVDDGSKLAHVHEFLRAYAERDSRIKVKFLDANVGIARATNEALALATGDFCCFLDHDDLLPAHALAEVASRVETEPDADVLYSDEDRLDEAGNRVLPFFKPDWSPDLLRSGNYICHFTSVRRSLLEEVGGIRPGFEGAQDFDLFLRLSERTKRIVHIPRVLYHWRSSPASMALDVNNKPAASDAGERALREHLARSGETAEVETPVPTTYRVRYPVRGTPLVSIIVPFKDKPELLEQLTRSLFEHETYSNFELLLISNNSVQPETAALLGKIHDPRVRKLEWDHPFNYSAINNFGAREAKGELLLFLNNDVEVVEKGWLEELIGQAQRAEVGAVGPKLSFPDGTLQHAGVVLGIGGFANHTFWRFPDDGRWTSFGHANWTRNFLAVTSACVMMRREVFDSLGGYDEGFVLCGSDVELCLRMVQRGLRVIYTPHTRLVHHESATRKADAIPSVDFWRSFVAYRPYLRGGDPFYNPNLSLDAADGSLRMGGADAEQRAVHVLAHELPSARLHTASWTRIRHQAHFADHVVGLDYTSEEVRRSRQKGPEEIAAIRQRGKIERIHWFVPYFGHPYGGVHTILRFGHLLRTRHGVENHFIIYDNPTGDTVALEARASSIFPELPGTFQVLRDPRELEDLPACDLAIATLWNSCYSVLKHPRAGARAYFIQDYEPQFYPAGTYSALAEQTYSLGFHGIFNTQGLHDYITRQYPMRGTWFEPSVDPQVFHADRPKRSGPVRLFFYGRPSVDRNAFELGLAVLRQLKKDFGAGVEILTAGEAWRPEDYGVEGVIQNLGVLPYERTGDLYRECDLGLCFMLTKHPSYPPLEMMACGVTVVTNDNPANHWIMQHDKVVLTADPVLSCVLEQLRRAVTDPALRARIGKAAAERMRVSSWEEQADRLYRELTSSDQPVAAMVSPASETVSPLRRSV